MRLTIKTVHMQHHVSLFPIGCPLQQRQRIRPCSLSGGAWAYLWLLIGLNESVLQQGLATSRSVVRYKPGKERTTYIISFTRRKKAPLITLCSKFTLKVPTGYYQGVTQFHCNIKSTANIVISIISFHNKMVFFTSVDICPSWVMGRNCRHTPAAAASLSQRCQCLRSSTPGWQPEPGSHPVTLEISDLSGRCNSQTCFPVPRSGEGLPWIATPGENKLHTQ